MRSSTSTRAEVSAAVTTSSKKGKVLAEDYHSSIVPALLSIAEKVKQQKNCLQKFSSNIQDDLGQMRSNVGKSLDEIVKIVSDTEQLVQEHFEQEEKSVADLKEINNQVVTSQETLKKTVDLMLTAYNQHHDEVGRLNEQASVVLNGLAEQNKPLKGTVEKNLENLTEVASSMEKEIGKHVEDAEKKTRTSVDESEEICENIEKAKNAVKTRSGQFFKESIEVVEKSHEDLKKANDQRKEVLENAQVLNQEKLSRVKSEYEGVLSDLLTKLKEEPKSSTEK